jgi:hypothetical protein
VPGLKQVCISPEKVLKYMQMHTTIVQDVHEYNAFLPNKLKVINMWIIGRKLDRFMRSDIVTDDAASEKTMNMTHYFLLKESPKFN